MLTFPRCLLIAAAATSWATPALAQQSTVGQGLQTAGQAVKRGFQTAGQAVSGGLQTAGQAVQGGFQRTRTSVHNMEVVSRVYSRLHWDKALAGSTVEIEVLVGGTAVLSGTVPSEDAKSKAAALTAETVGVNQVIDRLVVASPVRPAVVVPGAVSPAPSSAIIVTPPATTPALPRSGDTPL
jgi:hypothetical protein